MPDRIAVMVAKLDVWVKTTLEKVRMLNDRQKNTEENIQHKYDELNKKDQDQDIVLTEILANRKLCDKNFEDIMKKIAARDNKVDTLWDKYNHWLGWIAGIVLALSFIKHVYK